MSSSGFNLSSSSVFSSFFFCGSCERNMIGLPVRLTTGSCERRIERWMRSSWARTASACLASRTRERRSFSFSFSAASTSSRGMVSMMASSSSSCVSMLVSICSVPSELSPSAKMALYTSATLRFSSSNVFSCVTTASLFSPFRSRPQRFSCSTRSCSFKCSICALRPAVSSSIRACVSCSLLLSSSSASSVSCEFWIRKRFDSSSDVNMSRSCCGSLKYMSSASGSSGGSAARAAASPAFMYRMVSVSVSFAMAASRSAASVAFSSSVFRPRRRCPALRSASSLAAAAASTCSTASTAARSAQTTLHVASLTAHASALRFSRICFCSSNHS
mmetsp:Transcript_13217/g.42366  ORF Transcript_13217/g.42366 Transcript_13217/m.42366 type:complete len:332 (+) Transcript_13217:123-1118(+)